MDKVYQSKLKRVKDYKSKRNTQVQEQPKQAISEPKPVKRTYTKRKPKALKKTRAITDKYIVEQYEKRGLGKENKSTFWGALVSLFSK